MASRLTVRRATLRDRATLLEFHRALYVSHRGRLRNQELPPARTDHDLERALERDIDAILRGTSCVAFVAERRGDAVGYITGHIEGDGRMRAPRKGVIEDWYVLRGERRSGVGARLMTELLDCFERAGCEYVESTTWPLNRNARVAHRKLGFSEVELKFRRPISKNSNGR